MGGVVHSGDAYPASLLVAAAAGGSLALRRRAPGITLAVSGVLTLMLLHLSPAAGATAVIAPAVALYSLAVRRGARARAVAAVAAVVAVVVADLLHGGDPTLVRTLGHVLLIAIPLLIADVHRVRNANLELLQQRSAEQERLRIARDLHDVIAHTLTTINVQAATAAQLIDRDPAHARSALETSEEASRDAIDELRAILGVLRTGDARDVPLRPAPGLDDVAELVRRGRDDGVDLRLTVTGDRPPRVPEAVSLAAYRIVQESLTNARRHAASSAVHVTLAFEPDRVAVAIENDEGTPERANGHGRGVGIMGMSERAAAVGRTVIARPLPGGFRVDAELPYT